MRIVKLKNGYEYGCYKEYVRQFLPCIDIFNFTLKENEKIQESFAERLLYYEFQIEEKREFKGAACLIDRVFDALENDEHAIALLEFIDERLNYVITNLDKKLIDKFKPTLLDLFINFTPSGEQSHYFSRIHEIAFVALMLSTKKIAIVDIEYKLENLKCVDLVVQCGDRKVMMEIFSIRIERDKIENAESLKKFISKKIENKIQEKFDRLDESILGNCYLVPIFWGDLGCFVEYEDILSCLLEHARVYPPYGVSYYHLRDGRKEYRFDKL